METHQSSVQVAQKGLNRGGFGIVSDRDFSAFISRCPQLSGRPAAALLVCLLENSQQRLYMGLK